MTKNKHATGASFPEELMVEILLRVPVKSVFRFKCLCKAGLSRISNPQFARLHFDLAAPSHRLLLRVIGDDCIESIDLEDSRGFDSAVVYLPLPPLPVPVSLDSNGFPNRHPNFCPKRLQVCGSCRGFVLLHQYVIRARPPTLMSGHNFLVWNPSTGVHKLIPPLSKFNGEEMSDFVCGFGYDASNDDYLVILITFVQVRFGSKPLARIMLFSHRSNSWDCKYVKTEYPYTQDGEFDLRAGTFSNGALHWLVSSPNDTVILAFDLVERSLSEIPPPHVLNNTTRYSKPALREMGGCLALWVSDYINSICEMWIMEEYRVLSSWTRSFDVLVGIRLLSPISLTEDNILFGSDLYCQRLHKISAKTKKWLKETFTYGKGQDYHRCNLQCSLYRESLLSLPNND